MHFFQNCLFFIFNFFFKNLNFSIKFVFFAFFQIFPISAFFTFFSKLYPESESMFHHISSYFEPRISISSDHLKKRHLLKLNSPHFAALCCLQILLYIWLWKLKFSMITDYLHANPTWPQVTHRACVTSGWLYFHVTAVRYIYIF